MSKKTTKTFIIKNEELLEKPQEKLPKLLELYHVHELSAQKSREIYQLKKKILLERNLFALFLEK